MSFVTPFFLLLFMPLCVLLSLAVRGRARVQYLLVISLFFYGLADWRALLLLLGFSAITYAGCRLLPKQHSRLLLAGLIVVSALPLLLLKYAPAVGINLGFLLPAGISFYTFQGLSALVDVWRGDKDAQGSFFDHLLYLSFFPQLVAGPIVRRGDFVSQMVTPLPPDSDRLTKGMGRFIIGLSKKLLLADSLAMAASLHGDALGAWLAIFCFTGQIYFDFSGYSDMAIGLGHMFGITLPENFDHPYTAVSITDFWRRWHMTLSGWFRDYVYIPLGGNRRGIPRQIVNLLITWGLTGLWHGAGSGFLLWGLYYALLLILEKFVLSRIAFIQSAPKLLRRLTTFLLVMLGWALFKSESAANLLPLLQDMVCLNGLYSAQSVAWFVSLLPVMAVSVLLYRKWQVSLPAWAKYAACAVLMVLCVAALAGQSYHPFLYFRF